MKKLLIILAVAGLFMCASCSKSCDCKAKINGEVLAEKTVELSNGEKCSDYNVGVNVFGQSATFKCTPELF